MASVNPSHASDMLGSMLPPQEMCPPGIPEHPTSHRLEGRDRPAFYFTNEGVRTGFLARDRDIFSQSTLLLLLICVTL